MWSNKRGAARRYAFLVACPTPPRAKGAVLSIDPNCCPFAKQQDTMSKENNHTYNIDGQLAVSITRQEIYLIIRVHKVGNILFYPNLPEEIYSSLEKL